MCGIIGIAIHSKKAKKVNGKSFIVDGLKRMEYRGYDSSGFSFNSDKKIVTHKQKGRISELEKHVKEVAWDTGVAIGHTRWATHGAPNKVNSHPHTTRNVSVVHNGIIENYLELKAEILKTGYVFKSQTDTEVVTALIDYYYTKTKNEIESIKKTVKRLNGAFALGIIFKDNIDQLYAVRKDSPLILAKTDLGSIFSSDINVIQKYADDYYTLENYEMAIVKQNNFIFIDLQKDLEIEKEVKKIMVKTESVSKKNYSHYMLKEIYEQPTIFKQMVEAYQNSFYPVSEFKKIDWSKIEKIVIVACGTSLYSGLIGKHLINTFSDYVCETEIASEFRYNKFKLNQKTLAVFISQSGETADTISSLRLCKENNIPTLGIINSVESTIAHESDYKVFTQAGVEIAVASTKAFTSQALVLAFLAFYLKTKSEIVDTNLIKELYEEIELIEKKFLTIHKDAKRVAKLIYKSQNLFFLGRGIDYYIGQEASLKLKEITYIHSEAFAGGELKHGTISLINKNFVVIGICSQFDLLEKSISNIQEVNARGAHSIIVTKKGFNVKPQNYKDLVELDYKHEKFSFLSMSVFFQLLAYETAILLKREIDNPRNLAKSVTVE